MPVGYGDGIAGIVRGFAEAVARAGLATRTPAALAAVTSDALPDALARGADQAVTHPVRARRRSASPVDSAPTRRWTPCGQPAAPPERSTTRRRSPPARCSASARAGCSSCRRRPGWQRRRRNCRRPIQPGHRVVVIGTSSGLKDPLAGWTRRRRSSCRRRGDAWVCKARLSIPGNTHPRQHLLDRQDRGPAAEHARKRDGTWAAVKAPAGKTSTRRPAGSLLVAGGIDELGDPKLGRVAVPRRPASGCAGTAWSRAGRRSPPGGRSRPRMPGSRTHWQVWAERFGTRSIRRCCPPYPRRHRRSQPHLERGRCAAGVSPPPPSDRAPVAETADSRHAHANGRKRQAGKSPSGPSRCRHQLAHLLTPLRSAARRPIIAGASSICLPAGHIGGWRPCNGSISMRTRGATCGRRR